MTKIKSRVLAGVFICTPLVAGIQTASAVPVPGGSLDPLTIPKYVTPLVIPPVMKNTGTANDYDIAVRQFQQQILPGGLWANPAVSPACADDPACNKPATTVWSYGPADQAAPAVAPDPNSQFNYPAYTIENTVGVDTTVDWINDLVDADGNALPHLLPVDQTLHWANPLADCSSGELRTDCHGTTDQPYTGPVPIVTHVHGAHVSADSDGYTEGWWLPDADNITCVARDPDTGEPLSKPTGYDAGTDTWSVVCEGTIANQLTDRNGTVNPNVNQTQGVGNYVYQNDQPSTTIWYHDHSLGMTRLNVYAGPAGFWLIRDTGGTETGLASGILPGPAPVAGDTVLELNAPNLVGGTVDKRSGIREIPIVIQDRSFNDDGSLFYPDNRAFFEGLNVEGTAGTMDAQFPGAPELQIDMDPATSDIAPIWNPEAFFNTMVVNGVSWPKLEVAPAQYRFRLLNGCNSRFLNLALKITDPAGNPVTVDKTVWLPLGNKRFNPQTTKVSELNFFQIGAEQSLTPTVTAIKTGTASRLDGPNAINGLRKVTSTTPAPDPQQALLMGLAERADVIVDFRGLPNGTVITMTNTAPDAPFGGFPDVPADPTTTGQVMQFVVNNALLGASPTDELRDPVTGVVLNPTTAASNVEDLVVDPAALENFTVAVTNPVPRELALIEEESALICVDVDLAGNVVQLPAFTPVAGACVDAVGNVHPTALPFAPKAAVLGTVDAAGVPTVTLWSDPIATNPNANGNGTQTAEQWNIWNFTVDGHPIHIHLVKFKVLGRSRIGGGSSIINTKNGIQAWENGWKDTVISYPGEITSVAADFDINGLYVWHCHIVEHEDNEMMVPMCVGQAGVDCPAQLF